MTPWYNAPIPTFDDFPDADREFERPAFVDTRIEFRTVIGKRSTASAANGCITKEGGEAGNETKNEGIPTARKKHKVFKVRHLIQASLSQPRAGQSRVSSLTISLSLTRTHTHTHTPSTSTYSAAAAARPQPPLLSWWLRRAAVLKDYYVHVMHRQVVTLLWISFPIALTNNFFGDAHIILFCFYSTPLLLLLSRRWYKTSTSS